jgi:hypothetical protein
MTVFNRLIFNPHVDCDICPASPIPGLLGWRPWVCWWALCSLLLNLGWCCIISLACKLFFSSSLCVQTIYLPFFVFANNFFKNFPSPPLQNNNGPSISKADVWTVDRPCSGTDVCNKLKIDVWRLTFSMVSVTWKKIFKKAIFIKTSDIRLENNVKLDVCMFILERYYGNDLYNVILNANLHHVQPSCHRNTGTQGLLWGGKSP